MAPTKSPIRGILTGGVIAGILDITFAFLFYGMHGLTPVRILQSVASGLLGKAAFEGGGATAALGAVLQLVIPTLAASVYHGFTLALPHLRRRAVASGLVFGVVVYFVMNLVVVPLSAAPFTPSSAPALMVPALLAHMFFVGLPIALEDRTWS